MSSVTLYRASGLALLLGAVLTIIAPFLSLASQTGTPLWLVTTVAWMIGLVLTLLGLSGIVARQAPRAGWLGFVGFLLTFLGWLLLASYVAMGNLTISSWLVVHAPQVGAQLLSTDAALYAYNYVETALFVLGGVLLGMATMRARVFPRWAGLLLIVGAVLNPVGFVIGIVGDLSGVLLCLGLGWMGYALLRAQGEAEAVPQPVAAP